jgi:formate dehydrogenase maturation protein FdhE
MRRNTGGRRYPIAHRAPPFAGIFNRVDNCRMALSPWQRRIHRAQELSSQYFFAAEMLGFYVHVAGLQEKLHHDLIAASPVQSDSAHSELSRVELAALASRFDRFLSLAEAHGPKPLAELSRELQTRGSDFWSELLNAGWIAPSASDAQQILAQIFLQPYAELKRSRAAPRPRSAAYAVCPFCGRKPALGVLRQMGDGGARSMICSFCLAEWEFRRIVCPGCGEENDKKLAVYTAAEFDYIRVECCESCKTYIKTIDLTKNGRAEPLVDELASAPLDLWAREHGYAKLHANLFGM